MFSFYLDNLEILLLLLRIVFVVVFAVRVILVSKKKVKFKKVSSSQYFRLFVRTS